jgi:ankyrin repeat protein
MIFTDSNLVNSREYEEAGRRKADILRIATSLISKGASVNVKNRQGMTPLLLACRSLSSELATLLIAKHAAVNSRDADGDTPLYLAAIFANEELVPLIISHGADVNAKNIRGLTALHAAVLIRNTRLVKMLISKGARINSMDSNGRTPLHCIGYAEFEIDYCVPKAGWTRSVKYSFANKNREIADLLLASGADVSARTADGLTPLAVALITGNHGIAQVLRSRGAKSQWP